MEKQIWNENLIIDGIKEYLNISGLKRMPTRSELRIYYGDYKLICAISRYGGFRKYANILNLSMKESESETGYKYEMEVMDLLIEKGYKVEKMSPKYPYDLLVNSNVKIDVKAARKYLNKEKDSQYYTFCLDKKFHTCDIYILTSLEGKKMKDIFIIPSCIIDVGQISMGINRSKYNLYKNKWDVLDEYGRFYDDQTQNKFQYITC